MCREEFRTCRVESALPPFLQETVIRETLISGKKLMIESFLKKFSDNVYFRKETLEAISGKGIIDLRNIFTVGQLVWINAEIGPGKLN